jgi:alginate O-acetyltransferase complex protein AlgI
LASSVTEFWTRWHISLSTWFRDYLYIPLGGNRVGYRRWVFNILVVFVVSGLWHGAKWTFVVWGLLHGVYLVVERLGGSLVGKSLVVFGSSLPDSEARPGWSLVGKSTFRPMTNADIPANDQRPTIKAQITKWARKGFVFLLICLTWIFFRADTVEKGWYILKKIVQRISLGNSIESSMSGAELGFSVALIIGLLMVERNKLKIAPKNPYFWLFFGCGIVFCYLFGIFGQTQFIYFQF